MNANTTHCPSTFSLVSDLVSKYDYEGPTYRWNVVAHVPGDEVWMHDHTVETGDGRNPPPEMVRLLARIKAANISPVCRYHWSRVD